MIDGTHLLAFYVGLLTGWLVKALVFTRRSP